MGWAGQAGKGTGQGGGWGRAGRGTGQGREGVCDSSLRLCPPSQWQPFLAGRMVEHNEKAMDRFLVKALEHRLSAVDVQLLSKDRECPGPGQASLLAPISPRHRLLFSTVTRVNLLP